MRASWEALHASLGQSVRTLEAERQFNEVKQRHGALRRFEDPASLLDHLHRKATGADLDEKDAIYGALVRAVQAGRAGATLASSLIWLGLWPALDAIFRRRARLYPKRPEELISHLGDRSVAAERDDESPSGLRLTAGDGAGVARRSGEAALGDQGGDHTAMEGPERVEELISDLGDCLTDVVESIDFSRVKRITATLVWSTERDVVDGCRRTWEENAAREELPDDSPLGAVDPVEPKDPPPRSRFGLKGDLPDEDEVAIIRARLLPIVGDDVDLVIGAAIYGQSQRQLGERLGLTHEAARKRFQRALERLRRHLGRR